MAQATGTSVFSAPSFDGEGLSSKKQNKRTCPQRYGACYTTRQTENNKELTKPSCMNSRNKERD